MYLIDLYKNYNTNVIEKSYWDSILDTDIGDESVADYITTLGNIKYFSDKIDAIIALVKSIEQIRIPIDDSGEVFVFNFPTMLETLRGFPKDSTGIIQTRINGRFVNLFRLRDGCIYTRLKDDYFMEFKNFEFCYSKRYRFYCETLRQLL